MNVSRSRKIELLVSACATAGVLWYVWEASSWPFRAQLFPFGVGGALLLLLFLNTIARGRQVIVEATSDLNGEATVTRPVESHDKSGGPSAASLSSGVAAEEGVPPTGPEDVDRRKVGLFIAVCGYFILFLAVVWLLGFKWGAPLLIFGWVKAAAGKGWLVSLLVALGVYVFLSQLFGSVLNIPIENGVL